MTSYKQNLKGNDTNELIYKIETDSQTYGCHWKRMGDRVVREFGTDMYTLLYLRWITNKDLLYGRQNSVICDRVMWEPGWEGNLGENGYMFIYG